MAMKREYGKEQPGIRLGMFVFRLPFVHYRIELPEAFQAILMCATCLGAIPVITEQLGMPFEIAWGMVIINGFLYTLHATWGDPVVPGWITPSIPLTISFLATAPMGPERIRLMCALQLMVAAIFIIMGITGIANKLLSIVPASIKSGILMGAGFAAIFGEFAPGKRIDKLPITILVGAFVAFFCLFSQVFSAWRKKSKFWDTVGGLGMLPSVIVCIIVGVIVKEIVYDKFDVFPIFYVPDFKGIWNSMSPFALGWPTGKMFLMAIPQAIVTYIIAFGDFVTSKHSCTKPMSSVKTRRSSSTPTVRTSSPVYVIPLRVLSARIRLFADRSGQPLPLPYRNVIKTVATRWIPSTPASARSVG